MRAVRIRIGTSLSARSRRQTSTPSSFGQPEVEDHEVGHELLGDLERRDAVGRGAHLVALLAQRAAQDVGDLVVVLDDEHAAGDGLAVEHQSQG